MKAVLQKIGAEDSISFPRLRELKGKHGLTNDELVCIMGAKSHQTIIKRFRDGDFSIDEMLRIERHFQSLGESDTVLSIFFDWISTNVE